MSADIVSTVPIRVRLYNSFEALPSRYSALFSGVEAQSVFYTSAWFRNFISTISSKDESLRIYAAEACTQDETPVGILLMRREASRRGLFQENRLSGLQNYYSSLFGPILASSQEDRAKVVNALVQAITSETPAWTTIDMHPMDFNSPVFKFCLESFRAAGFIPHPYYCFGNWYLKVNDRPYKEYFEGLPSVLKNTIKRKAKKFEQNESGKLIIVTGGEIVEQAILDYCTVYNSSWKIPEPYPDFMPGLIRTCAQHGWLRLGLAYYENRPVAAQLWIVAGSTASIFKLAYDERFANLSAGSVLTSRLMAYVIDVDRVKEVDYLTGDDSYKKDWMSDRRERWGIVAMNPYTVGGMCVFVNTSMRVAARKVMSSVRRWT